MWSLLPAYIVSSITTTTYVNFWLTSLAVFSECFIRHGVCQTNLSLENSYFKLILDTIDVTEKSTFKNYSLLFVQF